MDLGAAIKEKDSLVAFLRLAERYQVADSDHRETIRREWPFGRKWLIPGFESTGCDQTLFAPLSGPDAHGLDPEARIETRLIYHSIENARCDYRDNFLDLCLCWHAALHASLDVLRLFEEAAALSVDPMTWMLRGYPHRTPKDKSLWAFGFQERRIEEGVVFEWIGCGEDYAKLRPKAWDAMGRVIELRRTGTP